MAEYLNAQSSETLEQLAMGNSEKATMAKEILRLRSELENMAKLLLDN